MITVPPNAVNFADVSFYQGIIDWALYRRQARAAILRLGQNTWPDPKFERNYTEAKANGVLLGGYWFFDGRASPQTQAQIIINSLKNKKLEMELFIDWEVNYGGPHEGLERVVALMQLIEAAQLNVKAIGVYTGYYFFVGNSNPLTHAPQYNYLKNKPLWLAWYSPASYVKIPPPWGNWTHWQTGTPSVSWGQQSKEIDMNTSNNNAEDFTAKYGGDPVIVTGGHVVNIKGIITEIQIDGSTVWKQ